MLFPISAGTPPATQRPDKEHRRATPSAVFLDFDPILPGWGLFIDELLREIERARVISPARVPPNVVTMHSTVRIRDPKGGTPENFTLVYPEDAAPALGQLSVLTPVGTALLGTRVGDVVRVETADGIRSFAVEAILYQPEAAARRERDAAHSKTPQRARSVDAATAGAVPVRQGGRAHA
jgi:regulator of nucleoside diphosphate kinase